MAKLRPGVIAGATVAVALTVSALSDSTASRNAASPIAHRPLSDADRPRAGETVQFAGDGFNLAWKVVDSRPDGLLIQRGEDLSYVDPRDVARLE